MVRAIRLVRKQVALDVARELERSGTVRRADELVGHEGPVKRDGRIAAARERVVAVAKSVLQRPRTDDDHDGKDERQRSQRARSPRRCQRKRNDYEHDERLIPGPHEREDADAGAEQRESANRRSREDADREQRPARERRCERAVRRKLVEENPVAGIEQQHDDGQSRSACAERPCGEKPRGDRARVQQRDDRFGKCAVREIQQAADEQ